MIPRFAGLLVSGLAMSAAASVQSPRLEPLPVETALSEKSLGLYSVERLSPDARRVAYTVCDPRRVAAEPDPRYQAHSRTGVTRFGVGCDVWVADTATADARNLTDGKGSSWAPHWSPDGRTLAFYSDRDGAARLWSWSAASGELRRVSDAIVRPWGASAMAWTPDGRSLVLPVVPEGMTLEQMANLGQPAAKDKSPGGGPTVTVFAFHPGAPKDETAAAAWSVELLRCDLAVIDAATGSVRRIASNEKIGGSWISPDGARVAYTIHRGFESAQSQQQLYELRVVPIGGGPPRALAARIPQQFGIGVSWSPDGKTLAYLTEKGDCFLVPAAGGDPRAATQKPHPPFLEDDSTVPYFSPRGDALFFLAANAVWRVGRADGSAAELAKVAGRQMRVLVPGRSPGSLVAATRDDETKNEGLVEVDLESGRVTRLREAPANLGRDPAFRLSAAPGGIVFAEQDAGRAEDLWFLAPGASEPRRLTRTNPDFDGYAMGRARLVEWLSADGVPCKGALLLPAGYAEGTRYPLVVFVYNGSRLSNGIHSFGMRAGWGTDDNFQLLATRGYAVLLPDAPSDRRDQMRDLPRTVLPGVNRVVDLGIADPERLGVMGHSNGGYSTLALVTLTTRFKAAVMRAGLGNFVSFYGELGRDGTHYGLGVAESAFGMGNPWDSRARYIENSPVFFLDRVQTPLLIVHGSNDDAVAVHLAEEVFVDLRRLGKEVVLARYEGEGHSLESFANQLDYVNRMLAWFGDHLKQPTEKP
ncbi:MAG TPA: prolyl oligopeptidase family serine peptidase [Thermoanaerobaculia bacterium]|nr:prolyl oligopeptidase family serine peptidase [Thermoanaerobaculia bacterium]